MRNRILAAFLFVSLLLCIAGCENRQSQTSDQQPENIREEKHRSNVMV